METQSKTHAHVLRKLLLLLAILCALPLMILAAPPAWWSNRSVTNTNLADDYAVANIGQAKNIASKARDELDAELTGGAGTAIDELVNSWSLPAATGVTRNDYAPITLGQLKTLAKPFYDRLILAGVITDYPWSNPVNPPDDFAAANLGQVKQLFSFDLTGTSAGGGFADTDGDGYPDAAELSRGSLVNDATSVPTPDIVVQPPTLTNPHPVQDAIDTLAAQEIDYGVIKLTAGNYPEHLQITDRPVILIGDGSYPSPSLDGENFGRVIEASQNCAFIGVRIIHGFSDFGGGIHLLYSQVRFTSCIFQDNEADHGGAVALQESQAWLQNCTLYQNVGNYDASGVHISGDTARLYADSSIFWNELNDSSPTPEFSSEIPGAAVVTRSDVRGGFDSTTSSNLDADPILNVFGRIIVYSPCINAFASAAQTAVRDIDNELRDDDFSDIGADEYRDEDNTFLPDAWEALYSSGYLGAWDDDPDNDGVINFDEYQWGTDPFAGNLSMPLPDIDEDGVPDDWETANGTDPEIYDSAADSAGSGLTNLERYQLSTSSSTASTVGTSQIELRLYTPISR